MKFQNKNQILLRAFGRYCTKNDLYNFNRYLLDFEDMVPHVHKEMCENFQVPVGKVENDYKCGLHPRNSLKTTCITKGKIIWELCLDPNTRRLIVGSTHKEAKDILGDIKERLERNGKIPFFYSDLAKYAKKSRLSWKVESIVVHGRTVINKEPSIDTAGRGTDKAGNHYEGIHICDVENRKTTESQEEIIKTKTYIDSLFPCMLPKGSEMGIEGTCWSFGDIYDDVKTSIKRKRGKYKMFRLVCKSANNPDGTLYYPERLTKEFLENELNRVGRYRYSCWYENDPTPEGDRAFPLSHLVVWVGDVIREGTAKFIKLEKIYKKYDEGWKWQGENKIQIRPFITVDPALSDSDDSCYTAIDVIGKDLFKNRLWLLEALRIKSQNPLILINEMLRLYEKYQALAIIIEDHAYQLALKTFFEEEARKANIHCVVETVGRSDRRSKEDRILGLQPFWKSDSLMIRGTGYEEIEDNEFDTVIRAMVYDEFHRFPKGKTRDLIDAFSRILDVEYGTIKKNLYKDIQKIEEDYQKEWE